MTWTEISWLVVAVIGWTVALAALGTNRRRQQEFLTFDDLLGEADKLLIRRANNLMRKIEAAEAYQSTVGDLPINVIDALQKELVALVGADAGAD